MERRALTEVLARCEGPIVALGEVALERETSSVRPGAEAEVAIGRVDASSLLEVTEQLRAAVKVGGKVVLVAAHAGMLGRIGAARHAPELTSVTEALLGAGLVEIGAAVTPGTLRRELLVWATLREP
jgi:hypothetical protein